jgi:predicted N-acetyltransferase YhbS
MNYTIRPERLSADEYIEFLKTTDLGSQYPKERFRERIETLVSKVPISLVARDDSGTVIGVVFGVTDFAYWLFVTDLGVAKDWEKQGISTALIKQAHEAAGGKKDIAIYLVANENAIPFYEKFGMQKSDDVMQFNHIEWTPFTVE